MGERLAACSIAALVQLFKQLFEIRRIELGSVDWFLSIGYSRNARTYGAKRALLLAR
jgi:hypothetical protein